MEFKKDSLDDLLRSVIPKIVNSKTKVSSTRGDSLEVDGVLLELSNPRARLSRTEKKGTIFSCLGELLWYLSGTNAVEQISYYLPQYANESDDGETIFGGYGPRFLGKFGTNQFENIIDLLNKKQSTRRAVIQIFDANDIASYHKDIPCTCTLQFLLRDNLLHMYTNMRSNDAFIGLPHDIFAFTMLQEIFARTIGVGLGKYMHFVSSLHIYMDNLPDTEIYMDEGWQEINEMPPMPTGNPWKEIDKLLQLESIIRKSGTVDINLEDLSNYWSDLARLLIFFRHVKDKKYSSAGNTRKIMTSNFFEIYFKSKLSKKSAFELDEQEDLNFTGH
ncbi:MAG: thymidylate synthase [Candidatus Thiodiazotropha endolucinida]